MGLYNPANSISSVEVSFASALEVNNLSPEVVSVRANRKKIILANTGNANIYVDFSNSVKENIFAFMLKPGGSYVDETPIYTGAYFAFCSTTSILQIREFV